MKNSGLFCQQTRKQTSNKAANSLAITLMRNLILFIPGFIILNKFFGLDGAIAAQPVVEVVLAVVCVVMYLAGVKEKSCGFNYKDGTFGSAFLKKVGLCSGNPG